MNTKSSNVSDVPMRRFSRVKVIADRLGVHPRTIFRWADQGTLTRYTVNSRVVLFDEAEVMALMESARIGPG